MIPFDKSSLVLNPFFTDAELHSVKLTFDRPLTVQCQSVRMRRTAPNNRLQTLAVRTFIGSCCTLVSSVTNLTVLMAFNGEVSWLCLICCNSDILFSALIIHWVTANDHAASKRVDNRHEPRSDDMPIATDSSDEPTDVESLARTQVKFPDWEQPTQQLRPWAGQDAMRLAVGRRRNSIS